MKVMKRNGKIVDFNRDKIAASIEAAYIEAQADMAERAARPLTAYVMELMDLPEDTEVSTDDVRIAVENVLFYNGWQSAYRAYVVYFERKRYGHTKIKQRKTK